MAKNCACAGSARGRHRGLLRGVALQPACRTVVCACTGVRAFAAVRTNASALSYHLHRAAELLRRGLATRLSVDPVVAHTRTREKTAGEQKGLSGKANER